MGALPNDANECFARCQPMLLMLARMHLDRRLWAKLDPEDLVQQTFAEAWQRWEQFHGDETQRQAWLRRALLNNVLDAVRRYRRAGRDVALERALDDSAIRLHQSIIDASTPSQHAAHNEDTVRLATALLQLTPAQQEAVVMHHLHGLKVKEVAEHLGRSTSAVAGLIHCGLVRLHRLLAQGDSHG